MTTMNTFREIRLQLRSNLHDASTPELKKAAREALNEFRTTRREFLEKFSRPEMREKMIEKYKDVLNQEI